MEATLHALGEIVLKGLPTFFLLIFLHFYLKKMLFGPLAEVLEKRSAATTGARKQAESAIARAEAKAKEYEEAIKNARAEVYRDNEALRKQWREEQAVQLADAKKRADSAIEIAKADLSNEFRAAQASLRAESERLADQIVGSVLRRTA